ncbi:uncharacterized protein BDZ99DRAFT_461239 [Mytilinidion resinicola]|uniref:F-box domain-containing protein n=1 Tax=Mytilinidion resinicola TaxID=574789 RepID=A0A6A6YUE4_9PEZI|nr:uncharacterized protein BDZ99DRAFT_461239 [Mytilinidion resinicola]KAF2812576.1 hypothetical protein BDZ99DRAFT_461239 [Mytilinidion resinicola]
MTSTTPFRLLSLPAELRETIYLFSFSTRRPDSLQAPAITHTCRLLRAESLPLFYKTQRFVLNLLTQTSINSIVSWLGSLSHHALLLIRRWTLLVRVKYYLVLDLDLDVRPLQTLAYMGVNIDLDATIPGGRVQEIRTPAVFAWIHGVYNSFYMNPFRTPLSRAEIECSDAAAMGFSGVFADLAGQVERLWVRRRDGVLGAGDYEELLMGHSGLRRVLDVHPSLRGGGQLEVERRMWEERFGSIAEGFVEAVGV